MKDLNFSDDEDGKRKSALKDNMDGGAYGLLRGSYFNQVGKKPMLISREEFSLGQEIVSLEYILQFPVSFNSFEEILSRIVKLRESFVSHNLRLVVKLAKGYWDYESRGNEYLDDLIQEGNLGLIRAAEKFDPEMGYKFSTYAVWWIRQGIERFIKEEKGNVKTPIHFYARAKAFRETVAKLFHKLEREPFNDEIAETLGKSVKWVERMKELISQREVSIFEPMGGGDDGDGLTLEDVISVTYSFEDQCDNNSLKKELDEVLGTINSREEMVLKLRFGLEDGVGRTLDEIGEKFRLTRERIRQIEARAIKKLRHPNRRRRLKDFI